MKERTKYLLIGVMIGIATGAAVVYLMMRFGAVRPFGFRDFARPENISNFTNITRPFRQAMGPGAGA